jgi:hypothetical protein
MGAAVRSFPGGRRATTFETEESNMTVYLSLLVALIGVLAYFASGNPKVQEIGRVSYFAGLLAFLLEVVRTVALPR